MRYIITIFLISCISFISVAQTMEFKVKNVKDTTANLAKYFGEKLYYADTAEFVNGVIKFDAAKHDPGIYALILPGGKGFFEVIVNGGEEIKIETNADNPIDELKVIKSTENKGYYEYINYVGEQRMKNEDLMQQMQESEDKEALKKQMEEISKKVKDFQIEFQKKYKNTLVAKIMKISYDVELDTEKLEKLDSIQKYTYYLESYFDNIDLKDDRLVKSPIFHKKLDNFFSDKTMYQIPDSIIRFCDYVIGKTDDGTEMFKYILHHVTYKYETSKVMGMDRVFSHLALKYYCKDPVTGKSRAFWLPEDKQEKICERGQKLAPLLIGEITPNVILTDSTEQNWINLHKLDSKFTILYFWDPNCGHCKKETPKLNDLYKSKLKDMGVEVFAVGKAMDEEFEAWKKFISENKLEFINVGLTKNIYDLAMSDARQLVPKYTTLESLNYSDTYDIYSTPKVFILDENKKIIAKQLSLEQIEDFFDRIHERESNSKTTK